MTQSVVVFPDAELTITDVLGDLLADRGEPYAHGVYVGTTVPDPRRPRMVIVRRGDGRRTGLVLEAVEVGIDVWAETEREVIDLTELVRALLWAAPTGKPICRVEDISGPVRVDDETDVPRRHVAFEVTLRGTPLT